MSLIRYISVYNIVLIIIHIIFNEKVVQTYCKIKILIAHKVIIKIKP